MAKAFGRLTSLMVHDPRTGDWTDIPLADNANTIRVGLGMAPNEIITVVNNSPVPVTIQGRKATEMRVDEPRAKLQPKVARHRCDQCGLRLTPAQWAASTVCDACIVETHGSLTRIVP